MRCVTALCLLTHAGLVACDDPRPPRAQQPPLTEPRTDGAIEFPDLVGRPDPDSGRLCGSLVVPIAPERPNFYFVLDASGSMSAPLVPPELGAPTLYLAARAAIAEVLRTVGHRVNFGAALFPGGAPTSAVPCPVGTEVFPTRGGDPVRYAVDGQYGPVLLSLLSVLTTRDPAGTTPTAATLAALRPTLENLPGETFVFLITDGAPNCNENTTCGADTCGDNVIGLCSPDDNCCDASIYGPFAPLNCIDADPTVSAVAALADSDIKTFVIGLPGTEAFADILDRAALAGQTGRDRSPYYYPVDRAADLADLLRQLGAQVAIECSATLSEAPPDPGRVNVYFDEELVPQDDLDGWHWISDTTIEIVGPACEHLQSGAVLQLQVAAGCLTIVR